ncbi:MAG: hypothetical protein KGL52_17270, partial [Rhodospirillales bacterium]|nr:hypothetical protein [Rhodospirillales bacterium]
MSAPLPGRFLRAPLRAIPVLAAAGLLGGCAVLNPAGWFHRQEGGVIAQQKGPLPGENKPYPNLATVPPAPAAPDLKALRQITSGLISDRAHARLLAEQAPLPDPSQPSTAPALFGVGSLPPPVPPPAGGGVASVSMPAAAPATAGPKPAPAATPVPAAAPAAAPPPATRPPTPPRKAPVAPVQSAALPPPSVPAGPPAPPSLAPAASQAMAAPAAAKPPAA